MNFKINLSLFFGFILLTLSQLATAQRYMLQGRVYDSVDSIHQPLAGAMVRYDIDESTAVTDAQGQFTIAVHSGVGELTFFHPDFKRRVESFNTEFRNNQVYAYMDRIVPPVRPLIPGDTIPDFLWSLPLRVVNHPEGLDTVRLSDYSDTTLLVLDLWSRGCKPCIESVDKMEQVLNEYEGNIALLTVHNDVSERALPFITKRGWKSPAVIGINRKLVTNSFYVVDNVLGGIVYIQNRRVLAITFGSANNANIELLHRKFKEGKWVYLYSTIDAYTYQGNLETYFHRLKAFDLANTPMSSIID